MGFVAASTLHTACGVWCRKRENGCPIYDETRRYKGLSDQHRKLYANVSYMSQIKCHGNTQMKQIQAILLYEKNVKCVYFLEHYSKYVTMQLSRQRESNCNKNKCDN